MVCCYLRNRGFVLVAVLFVMAMLSYCVLQMMAFSNLSQHIKAQVRLSQHLRSATYDVLLASPGTIEQCLISRQTTVAEDLLWWQRHACQVGQTYYVAELLQENINITYYRVTALTQRGIAKNMQQIVFAKSEGHFSKVAWHALL